jgi:hypothetical protein
VGIVVRKPTFRFSHPQEVSVSAPPATARNRPEPSQDGNNELGILHQEPMRRGRFRPGRLHRSIGLISNTEHAESLNRSADL